MDPTLSLVVAGLLLVFNAFLVLSEFAIVKVRSSRIEEMARKGSLNAALLKDITSDLDAYLSATQLGMTMASLGLGWIGEPAVARLLMPWVGALPLGLTHAASYTLSFGCAFAAITFLHVVLGELVPKRVAIRNPTRSALFIAVPVNLLYRMLYLPMRVLTWCSGVVLKALGWIPREDSEFGHSEEEFKILLSHSQEKGALPLSRLLLFENLFDFRHTSVKDIMTPAANIIYLSLSRSWEENWAAIQATKHTRFPLCQKDLSDVKGMIHFKDLLLRTPAGREPDLAILRRDVVFLQDSAPLEKALLELRQKRCHLGLIQNRSGAIVGMITLEDVLEELVGEIHDEFESPSAGTLSGAAVPEAFDMSLAAKSRADALRSMLKRLAEVRSEVNFKEAWDIVWKREMAITSGVGGGVALPHGRLPSLTRPLLVLGRSPEGVSFDSLDKKPVRLVFLILTPLKEPGSQLRMLAKIASLASNQTFRRNLGRAKTAKEAVDILQAFDQSVAE